MIRTRTKQTAPEFLLIGSYARGDQTAESGIDIVVILSAASEDLRDRIYDYLVDFMLEHDIDISLKLINHATYQEWRQLAEPFIHSIETEGLEV